MVLIIWLIAGGLLGWIASVLMRTDDHGVLLNISIGVVGAMLGGWIAPLLGTGPIDQKDASASALMASLLGAVILLAVVNVIRHRRTR